MLGNPNPRIIGAFVLGIALVGGAYVIGNFGRPYQNFNSSTNGPTAAVAEARESIAVTDRDGNGIEDWRDALVSNKPSIFIPQVADSEYQPPSTLTGELGINALERLILSKSYGPIGDEPEAVIERLVAETTGEVTDDLYTGDDIIIVSDSEAAVKVYANEAAEILKRNNLPDSEGELTILKSAIDHENTERLEDLNGIILAYKNMRDEYLNLPVPESLAAQHLDLINVFNALTNDITAFKAVFSDPVLSLIRLKRYQADAETFVFALRNMAVALEPFSGYFDSTDSAILFVIFHPRFSV